MTKEEIKARGKQRKKLPLPVDPWGEGTFALSIPATAQLSYEDQHAKVQDGDHQGMLRSMATLISLCAGTADGGLIFDKGDVDDLIQFDAKALSAAFQLCLEVNGMRKQDIEEAAKNSGAGPGAG